MGTRAIVRILVGAVGLAAIGLALADGPVAGPSPRSLEEQGRDERLLRAREDVEILELRLGTERARVQQAELRLKLDRALMANTERIRKKGLVSALDERRAEMIVRESETELASRNAELAEMEARFNRARRRVALLSESGGADLGIVEILREDVDDVTARMGRLEAKLDVLLDDVNRLKDAAQRPTR